MFNRKPLLTERSKAANIQVFSLTNRFEISCNKASRNKFISAQRGSKINSKITVKS